MRASSMQRATRKCITTDGRHSLLGNFTACCCSYLSLDSPLRRRTRPRPPAAAGRAHRRRRRPGRRAPTPRREHSPRQLNCSSSSVLRRPPSAPPPPPAVRLFCVPARLVRPASAERREALLHVVVDLLVVRLALLRRQLVLVNGGVPPAEDNTLKPPAGSGQTDEVQ